MTQPLMTPLARRLRLGLACLALSAAAACTGSDAPAPTATAPVSAQIATRAESGARLNAFRAEQGLSRLAQSPVLQAAAEAHAADMEARATMTHTGSDGSGVAQRVTARGYDFCLVAENIAQGQRSLDEVMDGWIGSPSHRSNMMLPKITQYGLARSANDYWVMVLGRPKPGC